MFALLQRACVYTAASKCSKRAEVEVEIKVLKYRAAQLEKTLHQADREFLIERIAFEKITEDLVSQEESYQQMAAQVSQAEQQLEQCKRELNELYTATNFN